MPILGYSNSLNQKIVEIRIGTIKIESSIPLSSILSPKILHANYRLAIKETDV